MTSTSTLVVLSREMVNMRKVAIVIPHGDDEALGFGGAILHHLSKGDHVTLVACRGPHDDRTTKQLLDTVAAKEILGYHDIKYLYVTEKEISNEPLKLFRAIEECLESINPDTVYTSFWGDIHQDHRIVYDCVARAVRIWGPLKVSQFFVGEIPSSTDQAPHILANAFLPNYYIPLTEQTLQKKIQAMQCYTTEIKESSHPRSPEGIRVLAKMRGIECKHTYAEALVCLRNIIPL